MFELLTERERILARDEWKKCPIGAYFDVEQAAAKAQRRKDAQALLERVHMPQDELCGVNAWIPRELYDDLKAIAEGRE